MNRTYRVARLSEVSIKKTEKNSKSEILGIAKFASGNKRADATFCLFDRCNDCGCDGDCSCDQECRRDCRCDNDCRWDCRCDDHFPCQPL